MKEVSFVHKVNVFNWTTFCHNLSTALSTEQACDSRSDVFARVCTLFREYAPSIWCMYFFLKAHTNANTHTDIPRRLDQPKGRQLFTSIPASFMLSCLCGLFQLNSEPCSRHIGFKLFAVSPCCHHLLCYSSHASVGHCRFIIATR